MTAVASTGRRGALTLLGAAALAACAPRRSVQKKPVSLFAAASLREVLDAAVAEHRSRSAIAVSAVYAGSAQLARQIAQGAPADLFISADEDWMDWLDQRGLIEASARRRLAGNRLVLVAPVSTPDTPVDLKSPAGIRSRLADGRLAIAEPTVPAGRYGREALLNLGLWPVVEDHLAVGADVRAGLALVARGETPLGVVYATDARAEPRVRIVATFPDASHASIIYSAAPIRRPEGAGEPVAARSFLDGLAGAQGQALFRRFGFAPPPA